jgi:thiamine-phosphate pyrophosphorylase
MFKLMLVTDRKRSKRPLTETVRLAIEGGVDAVQLRERDMPINELHALALELRKITRDAGAKLIINQRSDIALAVEADGVHLGWRSMSVRDVRKLGGKLLAGVSCHNQPQVRSAEEIGADYALLGPVFHTPSKEGLVEPLGLEGLANLVTVARLPVVAIGGITPENVKSVLRSGVTGVAVISAIISADDPAQAARALR